MRDQDLSGLVLLGVVFSIVYLMPSIIAFLRRHPNRWLILVINVAGGVTGFGWLLVLIWACHAVHKSPLTSLGQGTDGGESGLNIFSNDQQRSPPPLSDKTAQLLRLKTLLDNGSVSEEEFLMMKSEIVQGPAKVIQAQRQPSQVLSRFLSESEEQSKQASESFRKSLAESDERWQKGEDDRKQYDAQRVARQKERDEAFEKWKEERRQRRQQ